MDLSVIIVCYRGWERLSNCLKALDSFNLNDFSMEVIVVDNNSADGKIDDFEKIFSRFRFIRNRLNGGYANGCNLGAAKATGDFLMVLNPDTVVREEATGKLLDHARTHREYHIISCRQTGENGKERKAAGKFPGGPEGRNMTKSSDKNVSFPDWISGSLMMMRREVFQSLNGFDESFWMYYEDVDLCLRARKSGGEIALFNDIEISHIHGGSSRINLKTTAITKTEVQISRHFYVHKHLMGGRRIMFHTLEIADNLVTGFIMGLIGLVFFFVPRLFVRFLIMVRLTRYYFNAMTKRTWMSPRSVRFITKDNL